MNRRTIQNRQCMSAGYGAVLPLFAVVICATLVVSARAQNVEFRQTSDPAGVVSQTDYPVVGSSVSTLAAPFSQGGYTFTHWTLDGVRANEPSGTGANPVTFVITGPVDAVAHYLPDSADTDSDGVPDAYEIYYFGSLVYGPTDDPDGDGFTIARERVSDQRPNVRDERAQGGVSRRRPSERFVVVVGVGDPGHFYGGVSRRRSASAPVVMNPNIALLHESSHPAGVLDNLRFETRDSTVLLSIAPETAYGSRFTGWLCDGVRLGGNLQNQPIPITLDGDRTEAVARYIPEDQDSDGDGIKDWMEWMQFNTLDYGPDSDADGDGYDYTTEQFRGTVAAAHDDLAQGGVSRRRSVLLAVDTSGRVPYRETSLPLSIRESSERVPVGTVITTPNLMGNTFADYEFVFWDLDGVRQTDASGASLGTFTFTITAAATSTAHYVRTGSDTDEDGIPDAHELSFYGDLARNATEDTDGDGFTYEEEVFRGMSPRVADDPVPGGISRRRSGTTAVNVILLDLPPAVGPNAATQIGSDHATLSALVNPIGSPTTVVFEYGPTAEYGSVTPANDLGNGLQALTTQSLITGLDADTEYHFRVVATNLQGTTITDDRSFRTLPWNYDRWAEWQGVGAESDDEDADGINNLLEFAFNLNPHQPDHAALVSGSGLAGTPSLTLDTNSVPPVWQLEYIRRKNSGLVYTPLDSSTLAADSWQPLTGTAAVTDIDTNWERVVVEEHFDPASTPSLFFAVEVSEP